MQAGWYLWWHGSTRTSSPVVKSSVQIEHPNSPPAGEASALPSASSVAAVGSPPDSPLTVVAGSFGRCSISVSTAAPVTSGTWCTLDVPSSISISLSPDLTGSGSPNLTIGRVSSMALARPLARLCLGRPVEPPARGPYLSGCLWARMAPLAMTTRNNSVMIPVMLYRMLMATAVVGGGPPGAPSAEVPFALLEVFNAMRAVRLLLFCCRVVSNEVESLAEVIE